jgi:hypothetical protein
LRAALVRFWVRQRVLRHPLPLTGARALQADVPWEAATWTPAFLAAVAGRRRHSRAAAAIDILAATPPISATSLAAGLDMAVKNAAALLQDFCRAGIAVELTHRSKRRLFGLAGLAPLREVVRPPDRPDPTRGRGRPRHLEDDDPVDSDVLPMPSAPLMPLDRRQFDYSDLERWMAHIDQTVRHTRRVLRAVTPTRPAPDLSNGALDSRSSAPASVIGPAQEG